LGFSFEIKLIIRRQHFDPKQAFKTSDWPMLDMEVSFIARE